MTCLEKLLEYCKQHDIKLTNLRLEILTILAQASQPMSAYDILETHQKIRTTANIMSTYRILDFFIAHDLCHKINSKNTYTICCHPNQNCCQLLVCRHCGKKHECHSSEVSTLIQSLADKAGFTIEHSILEISGTCKNCKEVAP